MKDIIKPQKITSLPSLNHQLRHPERQKLKTEKTVKVYSSSSGDVIEPTTSGPCKGFIIHGNIRCVTENILTSYGGLIGNNFTTPEALENTNEKAFTAKELLGILNFPIEDLLAEIVDRTINKDPKHPYYHNIVGAIKTLKTATETEK